LHRSHRARSQRFPAVIDDVFSPCWIFAGDVVADLCSFWQTSGAQTSLQRTVWCGFTQICRTIGTPRAYVLECGHDG